MSETEKPTTTIDLSEPVEIVPMSLVRAAPLLLEALKECADDLEAELKGRYTSLDQPVVARRFERDMETVRRARSAIAAATGDSK